MHKIEENIPVDISKTPFSKYGSYLSVTYTEGRNYLTIHNVRRRFAEGEAYKLHFTKKGEILNFGLSVFPHVINVKSSGGNAKIFMQGDKGLMIECEGMDIHLEQISPKGYGVQETDNRFKMISVSHRIYTAIEVINGEGVLKSPLQKGPGNSLRDHRQNLMVTSNTGKSLLYFEMSIVEQKPSQKLSYNIEGLEIVKKEWEEFYSKMPAVPDEWRDISSITWFNLWSCYVKADDVYKYDAMLMSKKYMSSVWSWDHCFNALVMARIDLNKAIEQFLLPFELQSESGALPDMWNPNSEIVWGVTKPPIHGWCFNILMDNYEIENKILSKVYAHLEKWTKWWMEYRDSDGDGVPEYPQGCDSGWDNSTLFDIGFFLESPDLSAYLVLQMKTLVKIADKLGNTQLAGYWSDESDCLLAKLYKHSWDGEKFVAKLSRTHEYNDNPTSLLALMPIVLGTYLDKDIFNKLVVILKKNFLTENGPATESIYSPLYESDGYWRGPIWAPSTYLLVDGLRRGGEVDLAKRIAHDFCNMIRSKANGNFENFDALSGKGLRAPGYTWTASINILFIWEYFV